MSGEILIFIFFLYYFSIPSILELFKVKLTKNQCEQAANTRLKMLLLPGRLKSLNTAAVD